MKNYVIFGLIAVLVVVVLLRKKKTVQPSTHTTMGVDTNQNPTKPPIAPVKPHPVPHLILNNAIANGNSGQG